VSGIGIKDDFYLVVSRAWASELPLSPSRASILHLCGKSFSSRRGSRYLDPGWLDTANVIPCFHTHFVQVLCDAIHMPVSDPYHHTGGVV